MNFERTCRTASVALASWEGSIATIEYCAELYEDIVRRAPFELRTLRRLPRRQGVGLWLEVTAQGTSIGSKLLGVKTTSAAARENVRFAVQRIQRATAQLIRFTSAQARAARAPSAAA